MPQSTAPSSRTCAMALRAATSQLTRVLRSVGPPDAGSAALSVMGALYRRGPMAPSELARLEGVRVQTLTRLLADLETQGLIHRQPDELDRRKSQLSLAAGGRKLLAQYVQGHESSLESAIATELTEQERQQLLEAAGLMERLSARLLAGSTQG